MYNLPSKALQAISHKPMASPVMKKLFRMTPTQRLKALDQQAKMLEAQEIDPLVVVAYQTLAPMWVEREALEDYLTTKEGSKLTPFLQVPATLEEALMTAQAEWSLDQKQTEQLRKLLAKL